MGYRVPRIYVACALGFLAGAIFDWVTDWPRGLTLITTVLIGFLIGLVVSDLDG